MEYPDQYTLEALFREADLLEGAVESEKLIPIINFSYTGLGQRPMISEVVELRLSEMSVVVLQKVEIERAAYVPIGPTDSYLPTTAR